jgi:hypothetical protein
MIGLLVTCISDAEKKSFAFGGSSGERDSVGFITKVVFETHVFL